MMKRTFIIRLSSLGDVAISVPLIYNLSKKFAETTFVVLSKSNLAPLFENLPKNVTFKAVDTKGKHKGLFGLFKLFDELEVVNEDIYCDIHSNLRSIILGFLFRLKGSSCFRIYKDRFSRKNLTRKKNKIFKPLISSFNRYKQVFENAGFSLPDITEPKSDRVTYEIDKNFCSIWGVKENIWLGIAPFAKHKEKIYPLERMEKVVARFANDNSYTVFLFGGGTEELAIFEKWKNIYPTLIIPYGIGLGKEMQLIGSLDLMLTMDSANLHIASMMGIAAVSVWGATHPYSGFYGLGQKQTNAIQIMLSCRPCSVYGEKECYRGDFACMNGIKPEVIIEKIETEIRNKQINYGLNEQAGNNS